MGVEITSCATKPTKAIRPEEVPFYGHQLCRRTAQAFLVNNTLKQVQRTLESASLKFKRKKLLEVEYVLICIMSFEHAEN